MFSQSVHMKKFVETGVGKFVCYAEECVAFSNCIICISVRM